MTMTSWVRTAGTRVISNQMHGYLSIRLVLVHLPPKSSFVPFMSTCCLSLGGLLNGDFPQSLGRRTRIGLVDSTPPGLRERPEGHLQGGRLTGGAASSARGAGARHSAYGMHRFAKRAVHIGTFRPATTTMRRLMPTAKMTLNPAYVSAESACIGARGLATSDRLCCASFDAIPNCIQFQ
jgi:hypothetical protein